MLRWRILAVLYGIAIAIRAVTLLLPDVHAPDGDWPVYATVARNILDGCGVSLSPPGSGECRPHFGGNGLPGYPAFIAVVWSLSGGGKIPVLWAQALVSALAVPRLAYAVSRLAGARAGLLCGAVAALSPLQAFMVRYGLAEALTLGALNWLLAELALSLAVGRLRVVAVAAPLAAALFLRLDSVVYTVPVAIVALQIHGLRIGLLRGVAVAVCLALPLGSWTARNLAAGVPVLPTARQWMLPDGSRGPLGYLAWLREWVTNEDQRSAAAFFQVDTYQMIHLLPGSFLPAGEAARAQTLLDQLKRHAGQPFPPAIDAAFATMAADLRQSRPALETAELRLIQGATLWRSWIEPLPKELRPADGPLSPGLLLTWLGRALGGSASALLNTLTRFYRVALGLAFLVAVATLPRQPPARAALTLGASSIVLLKSTLAATGLFLEARYNVTAVPIVELTVMLMVAERLWQQQPTVAGA